MMIICGRASRVPGEAAAFGLHSPAPYGGNAMITLGRTYLALPGKAFDLVAAAKESTALGKRVTGIDFTLATAFGGNVGEIAVISNFDSMTHLEETNVKLMADAEFRAATSKTQSLTVPRASRDQFWRHV